jgi:putative hemolysin
LPVYRNTIDQVIGILHVRDLLGALHGGGDQPAEALANAPFYVPENKPLRDLLAEMQALHQQMAIVVDEYGGVAGLVTVEDLVEEIVGEINDEHEATGIHHVRLDEERWQLPGRIHLEDLVDTLELDLDLDALPYETLSGWICGELGHVPKEGDSVHLDGLSLLIEEADERRVTSVVVRRVQISAADQDGDPT